MQVELKKPKYVQGPWRDQLDRPRCRFRRPGHPGCELPVRDDLTYLDFPEFWTAYLAALKDEIATAALAVAAARSGAGTVKNAVETYLTSTSFLDGSEKSTQALRRPILKRLLKPGIAELPLDKMDETYIARWLEQAPTKGTQNTRLLALRPFFAWAVRMKLIKVDPTERIRKAKVVEGEGHWTWQPEEVERYRAHYPLGTRERLALELMLTVTARRGDAISLGWQHLKSGGTWLEFTQEKNRRRKPSVVSIPMPPELTAAIEACPSPPDSLTFLTNEWGKPYSKKAFNTAFRKWSDEAGLPERCVPHGVRKGGSKRMADQGCNESEIMSHTGHRTSKEVQRYIRDYDRKQAAIRAANKLAAAQDNSNVVPLKVAAER